MEIFTIDRKQGDFVTIYKEPFRDKSLSLKARGFLATLLTLGPGWDFSVKGIATILKERRDAIYSIIKELQEAGYCHRYDLRDEQNRIAGTHYAFSEYRREWPEKYEGPFMDSPYTKKPYPGNPYTGNPTQYNTKPDVRLNGCKTEQGGVRPSRFVKPSLQEVMNYCRERGNTIDAEAFIAFYESVGWKVGNKPMQNWKSAVITWEKRENKTSKQDRYGNINNGRSRATADRLDIGSGEYEESTL